jgi:hypothetical protein
VMPGGRMSLTFGKIPEAVAGPGIRIPVEGGPL